MTTIREQLEDDEERVLSPFAQRSRDSKGRARPEPPDPVRPIFQHDRDRIIHSKAFRRLAGKTQVFLAPEGDHYRTRITHTLEVAQIARTVTRALRLNETLTEAIVMGHDLGHTPFGHAGEKVLAKLMPDGFHHVKQSLRVVEKLERDGQGLNLSVEVRDGILKHSKGKGHIISDNPNLMAMTLEGQIVRISDIVAYVNHDLDDAVRGRVVDPGTVPRSILDVLGDTHGERIARMVDDMVSALIALMGSAEELTGPINLGNPDEFTILELAQKVIQQTGSRSEIVFAPLPADDPRQRQPDIRLAREHLRWQPSTPLAEGLTRTIEYFDDLLRRRSGD